MQKLTCKIILWDDWNHIKHISISICDLIFHTDFNPYGVLQEEDLYKLLTGILYELPDETIQEQIDMFNKEPFKPHEIIDEHEIEVMYFDDNNKLRNITIQ